MIRKFYRFLVNTLPPPVSQRLQFLIFHGRLPNLRTPRTFNEHLVKMKLTWDDPRMVQFADKLAVKEVVAARLGGDWVTPTLWSGTSFPESPNFPYPYAVKANHGSGQVTFVRSADDEQGLSAKANAWLERRMARKWGEEWYNQITPQLLVEPMLGNGEVVPVDFKIFCFDGTVACVQVDTGRFKLHKRCFYDTNWSKLPIQHFFPFESEEIERPRHLDRILAAAAELSKGFPFARVDFYDLEEGPRFGEVTFCPDSAFGVFNPRSADEWLGSFWPKTRHASDVSSQAGTNTLPQA